MINYRFAIAISFAGDNKRDRVRQVAEILRESVGDGRVFFDEWFEVELAGHDANTVLQNIYRESTQLVVTCVCKRYNEKPWTQEEWRAIQSFERTLRDAGTDNKKRMRFLPIRFGDGEVDGIFDTAIVPDIRERSPEAIAELILQRLAQTDVEYSHEKVSVADSQERSFADDVNYLPNNLPHSSLATMFKGRNVFLEDLHRQLTTTRSTTINSKAIAVLGTGGIGKTRVAIEYAWRYAADYSALLFVSAESPESLGRNLAGLTAVLPIEGLDSAPDDQRQKVVLKWLQTEKNWLLILDNVDTEVTASAVKAQLTQLAYGRVLITGRIAQWSAGVDTLNMDVLSVEDSASYLLDATIDRIRTDRDTETAERIAGKVGNLPLGLEHAAAWVNSQYLGFDEYLQQWDINESKILKLFDQNLIEYPRELLVTWKLSVDRLDDEARELLNILSWLSPAPIPDLLFQAIPEEASSCTHQALATLAKYSLISRVQLDQLRGFQVHRLVQATTRYHQRDSADDLPALNTALEWVNEVSQREDPSDVKSWPLLDRLDDHALSVCQHAIENDKTNPKQPTVRLLAKFSRLYYGKARYGEAEPLIRSALKISEQYEGESHLSHVPASLNNLATVFLKTNRLAEAEALMRRSLNMTEQYRGGDHVEVALRLGNLGQLLQGLSRLDEAEPLMRRALSIIEQSDDNDLSLGRNLNNLARLLKDMGRLDEAEPLMRRALSINEQAYYDGHIEVGIVLGNLGTLLKAMNRFDEAEPLLRRSLNIYEQAYDGDHPSIGRGLSHLGLLLKAMNRFDEAEPLLRRSLNIYEQAYDGDHPSIDSSLSHLGLLLKDMNRFDEAEPFLCRLVKSAYQFQKLTDQIHPKMEIRIENYKKLLIKMGKFEEEAIKQIKALQ